MKKIAGGGSLLNLYRSELFGIAALLIVIGHSQDFVRAILPEKMIEIIGYGGIAAQDFAHRYEVSSRRHSGSCGEDAIIRIEDKKLLPRVIEA